VNYWSQGRRWLAFLASVGTLGVLRFSVIQHAVGLTAARKKDSMHELEGCLYTLHAVLMPSEQCRLRLAVHRPTRDALEQVTEYVGDKPKPGRIGRLFPANAAIIGKAFRENEVLIARRINDDYEAYVKELITDWNYTEERARLLNPGAMEWMAVPLTENGKVEAIVYLDVNQRGFLTDERQELVLAAVRGIAVFVGRRYSKN
jgi:GAF domain